jgi:glycosyltransferase involved in cell wall biosynthesis
VSGARHPRLTVVSRSFPPQVSGSAILLTNLLAHYPCDDVSAVAGYERYSKADPMFLPPCPTRYLRLPRLLPRVYDRLKKRLPAATCYSLRRSLRGILRSLGTDVVLAVYPFDDYFVASFLAARDLNIPFYAHMHDLWTENMPAGSAVSRFARVWEPRILSRATRVLCMTEAMQGFYGARYGLATELLPHCVPEREALSAPAEMRPPRMPTPTVLFVGSVSEPMNLDALRVLAAASELLPQGYELLFCTSLGLPGLEQLGIRSSRLRAIYVSRAEVQRLQSEAHVLVAPLSHKHCCMDEVRTVFSTKLLEYLVAGRPILVFAPEGSYHARSARAHGWGYVVSDDSPAALAAALVNLVTDQHLAAGLVRGALREARARSATRHAARLREWVLADTRVGSGRGSSRKASPQRLGRA